MQRSKHGLSRHHLLSLKQGELTPCFLEEVLPGDSFRHRTSALIRVSPLVSPVMHPCQVYVHHWFVPSRLLWDNWEPFITGKDPNLTVPVSALNMAGPSFESAKKLAHTFGIGADSAIVTVNALPFRAYQLIWNEYYRDQDLHTKLPMSTGNGPDDGSLYGVQKVSWEKDYYTTSRPSPQMGTGEVIQVGLAGMAPVKGLGTEVAATYPVANQQVKESDGTTPIYPASILLGSTSPNRFWAKKHASLTQPDIFADLSAGSGITFDINQWRQSMAYQRFKEHRNRYGSRYTDLLAYFGITSSDARLQRPEYLGGGRQTISFSEVLSTAETTGAVVGDMAGHGIAAMSTTPYKRFFEEHGYVMSLLFVRPMSIYMNRIPRTFLRRDWEHYWQRELEMMGDQAIQNNEIYGDSATPTTTFGYIPRYDDYRHGESVVAGEFRTVADSWHLARKFTSQPVLNASFVTCDPATRIYASTTTDQLYCMIAHQVSARRLVSKHARN